MERDASDEISPSRAGPARGSAGPLTPSQRSLRARAAAYRLHSLYDSAELTDKARAAFNDRFTRQVDPTGDSQRRNASVAPHAPARRTTWTSRPARPTAGSGTNPGSPKP